MTIPIQKEKSAIGGMPSFRVWENRKSSFVGPDLFTGLSVGVLANTLLIASNIVVPGGFLASLALPAIGAGIGSLVNKFETSRNQENGRVISPPSPVNREMFRGAVSWMLLGKLAGIAIGWATGLGAASLLVSIPMMAAGGVYGMISGSKRGVEHAQLEYNQAQTIYAIQNGELGNQQGIGLGHTLVPALGAGAAIGTGVVAAKSGTIPDVVTGTVGAVVANDHAGHAHQNPYDFSHLGADHPAAQARRSFAEAERQRPDVERGLSS